jgi:hypothetical protein
MKAFNDVNKLLGGENLTLEHVSQIHALYQNFKFLVKLLFFNKIIK